MTDFDPMPDDGGWIAGFEGDRRVVVARIGPFQRLFQRPQNYVKKLHHTVYDLPIEEWSIALEAPSLGPLCEISAALSVRFQATLAFARQHPEHLGRLGDHIRERFKSLLKDVSEEELRRLETAKWLDQGQRRLERDIEDLVHELLATRDIQSRCRCTIEARLHEVNQSLLDQAMTSQDPTRQGIALEIIKRRREAQEQWVREQHEQQLLEQRLKLEQQQDILTLLKQESELLRAERQEMVLRARELLQSQELQESEKIDSEIRIKRERLRHETELNRLELKANLDEKEERTSNFTEVQSHLQKEIELLAMERQRLALEEEIHKTKVTRAKGWFSGVKNMFSAEKGPENNPSPNQEGDE